MFMSVLGYCLLFFAIMVVITVICCAKVSGNCDRWEEEHLQELLSKLNEEKLKGN